MIDLTKMMRRPAHGMRSTLAPTRVRAPQPQPVPNYYEYEYQSYYDI